MSNDNIEFHFANAVMPVKNVKATARFYKETLGFNIDVLWQNPNYGCVSRGGITIEFGEGRPNHVGSGACVIQVSDVDAIYKEYRAQDITFIGDFAERDYGSKDFRVKDNDGNLLVFGGALENKEELIANGRVA